MQGFSRPQLEAAEILASAGKIRGTRVVAPDSIAALAAFADRAGRRSIRKPEPKSFFRSVMA